VKVARLDPAIFPVTVMHLWEALQTDADLLVEAEADLLVEEENTEVLGCPILTLDPGMLIQFQNQIMMKTK
jgi:hypothetical protein